MSNLNPDQFLDYMRNTREHPDIGVDDQPYFHGTSHEAAEKISQSGFTLAQQANGRSGGEGVYLHENPYPTRQYGPATVAVQLNPHLKVHPNPYNDEHIVGMAHSIQSADPEVTQEHSMQNALRLHGYDAHYEPDDRAMVVYNPDHVHYLSHNVLGEQW